eukprot:260332-Pyramimonas_sp.AAC.1
MDPIKTHLEAGASSSSPRGVAGGCVDDAGLVQPCLADLTRVFPVLSKCRGPCQAAPLSLAGLLQSHFGRK